MVEFRHNAFVIEEQHLSYKTFPYSKVLQAKYGSTLVYREFKNILKGYFETVLTKDIELIRKEILEIKAEIQRKYPNNFDRVGWYDYKVWLEHPDNEEERIKIQKRKEAYKKGLETRERRKKELEERDKAWRLAMENKKIAMDKAIVDGVVELGQDTFTIKEIRKVVKKISYKDLQNCKLIEGCGTVKGRGFTFRLKEVKDE